MGIPPYVYSRRLPRCLQQGDILKVSGQLTTLLDRFYPGIRRPDVYKDKYLMVLSQSCDLFAGNGRLPNVEHISLCLVRKFDRYISRITGTLPYLKAGKAKLIDRPTFDATVNKLARLVNNSENKSYFFLPQHSAFPSDMVAILGVSYPVRVDNYNLLLEHRVCGLDAEFQAKLGMVISKLYGRVATRDLSDHGWSNSDLLRHAAEKLSAYGFITIDNPEFFERIRASLETLPKADVPSVQTAIDELEVEFEDEERKRAFSPYEKQLRKTYVEKVSKLLDDENLCGQLRALEATKRVGRLHKLLRD